MIDSSLRQWIAIAAICLSLSYSVAHAAPELPDYRAMKYGFFVHYVWGGDAYSATVNKDGSKPAGIDDLADRFDAECFARDMAAMNVEYVLFTAWHANINPLYPSKVMEKWLPGHSCKRDLIGDMIKACKAKGIHVLLYTHPRDGHDLSDADMARTGWHRGQHPHPDFEKWNRDKWNDFINEKYAELVDRYGKDILGLYLDEGSGDADSYRVVDYPRLRKTITAKHPHLLMMQNDYGNLYTADMGNMEIFYHHTHNTPDGDRWKSYKIPITIVCGSIFWASFPEGQNQPAQKSDKVGYNPWIHYSPEAMYRYTVFQAAANVDGGGTLWAAGPYPGGGWEVGVLDRMKKTGELIRPVECAIKNTYPSTSYPTVAGSTIADLTWGVATQSTDGLTEYLHVLKAPGGTKTLRLPAPADGKKFSKAVLLKSRKPVDLKQNADGLELTLPANESWDALNTVIALQVSPTSPSPNWALRKSCRASSLQPKQYAMLAVDGDLATSWVSAKEDPAPACSLDLGQVRLVKKIEISGQIPQGMILETADLLAFDKPKKCATSPEPKRAVLEIIKASYGKGDVWMDVTNQLRAAAQPGSIQVKLGLSLAGTDPVPNVLKETKVEYRLNGELRSVTVTEDGVLTLGEQDTWVINFEQPMQMRYLRLKCVQPQLVSISDIRVFTESR